MITGVMIGLMTSTQDALTYTPRAEEVEEVTAMLVRLQVKEEDLAPRKGNWAYHKSSPSPDDLSSPTHSTINDVLPEEWDETLNPQEAKEEEEEESLNSGQGAHSAYCESHPNLRRMTLVHLIGISAIM